jgi:outer membrane protein assembly factor BamB
VWKFRAASAINSSPVLTADGGVVVFGSADHNVYALHADSGDVVWKFVTAGEVFAAPALNAADTVVYAASRDGALYAIDAQSGRALWSFNASTPTVRAAARRSSAASCVWRCRVCGGCPLSVYHVCARVPVCVS